MKEFFQQLIGNLKKLSPLQRASLIGAVVLVFIVVILLIVMKGEVNYTVLFSNMGLKEASAITKKLESMGEKYKYKDGTIYVLQDRKGKILLTLASSDLLPEKGETFSKIFEKEGYFGVSKVRERIDYIRGLQGRIERTLCDIEGVEVARVHIVLPEESTFVEDEKPATASILLKLKPFFKLTPQQVKGIIGLVAYSVPKLDPKNVKVVDFTGKTLSDDVSLDNSGGVQNDKRMLFQKEYENYLKKKASSMLERVVGEGNVVVRVTAELNFDKIERKIKNIATPISGDDKGVPISQQSKTENYEGTGPIPAGVPGTKTNIPNYKTKTGEKNNKYQKTEKIVNYDYNQMLENHTIVPGDIKRLTIAVIINSDQKIGKDVEKKFIDIVKSAVGFNKERGDSISFMAYKFNRSAIEKEREEYNRQKQAEKQRMIILSLVGFFLLLGVPLFLHLVKIYKQKKLEEARREEERRRLAARKRILEPMLSVEEQEKKDKQDRVKQHVMEKPEEAAQIVRTWLNEE